MQCSVAPARYTMVGAMLLISSIASAQHFPTKPLRIVASDPGGSGDQIARVIVQGISGPLGQPVIVDNRPVAYSLSETVAKAPPDGYTMLMAGSALWLLPYMRTQVSWDPIRSFAPISWLTTTPCVVVVNPALAAKSVNELIALAKARPGVLNYGSGASGAITHLALELFKSMTGADIVRVPYKAAGAAITGLIAGEVQIMFATAASISSHVKSGKVRALAVASSRPSALFPNLPTMAGAGLQGYEAASTNGIFTSAGTPVAVIRRLNQEIVRVLTQADVREKLLAAQIEVVASSPEALAAMMKSEMARMGKVIKDAGIRDE